MRRRLPRRRPHRRRGRRWRYPSRPRCRLPRRSDRYPVRPVVVDEMLLVLGAAGPAEHCRCELLEAHVVGLQRRRRLGEPKDEQIRLRSAGEGRAVEAGLALGVLAAPPGNDLVHVGRDQRRPLGGAIRTVGGEGVDDANRPAGDGGRPVDRRRRATPRRRRCGLAERRRSDGREAEGDEQPACEAVTHPAPGVAVRVNFGSVPARRRPTLCRWSATTPIAAAAPKPTTGHELPNARQRTGSATAAPIEASDA